jgi:hypothetical protein
VNSLIGFSKKVTLSMNKQTNKQTMREPKLTGEAQVEEGRAGAGAGAWT